MRQITYEELLAMLPDEETLLANDPVYGKYLGWEALDREDKGKLTFVGELNMEGTVEIKNTYVNEYWGADAPQALAYWPYHKADIYRYGEKGGLYFRYLEMGGHAAEERCRLVRRSLFVLDKI